MFEMPLPGRIANVKDAPPRSRFPGGNILKDVARQGLCRRIALATSGHVHLTEQQHALSFAVLEQWAELKAEAAIKNRHEIAAGGLLDQGRGDVTSIAGPPRSRDRDVAPAHL